MGLFDDAASVISHKSGHRSHSHSRRHSSSKDKRRSGTYSIYSTKSYKSRSRSRSRSPGAKSIAGSFFGLGGDDHEKRRRHSKHDSGFFGLPNISTRSFFGGGGMLLPIFINSSTLPFPTSNVFTIFGMRPLTYKFLVHKINIALQPLTTAVLRGPTSSTARTNSSSACSATLSTMPNAIRSRFSRSSCCRSSLVAF